MLTLDTQRSIVTSLYLTIQEYWKYRKSPVCRGYVKQSLKALREIEQNKYQF